MRKTFKAISIIGFILSGIFTIVLWQSSSIDVFMKIILTAVAIVIELSKLSLAYVTIHGHVDGHKIQPYLRISAAIGAILCFGISIVASLSLLANSSQETKQVSFEESKEYQARTGQINVQQDLYNSKKAEIEVLQKQADSWPANYSTKRQGTLDQKSERETELQEIGSKLQELKDYSTVVFDESASTTGFKGLCCRVCKWLNGLHNFKKSPLSPSDVEYYFFAAAALLFDLTALLSYLLSQEHHAPQVVRKNVSAAVQDPNREANEIDIEDIEKLLRQYKRCPSEIDSSIKAPEKNIHDSIGFKFSDTPSTTRDFDDNNLNDYLVFMYENKNNDQSPGTDKFKRNTDLTYKQIKGIRYYLECQGIVKNEPTRTAILISDLNQAREKLGLK